MWRELVYPSKYNEKKITLLYAVFPHLFIFVQNDVLKTFELIFSMAFFAFMVISWPVFIF